MASADVPGWPRASSDRCCQPIVASRRAAISLLLLREVLGERGLRALDPEEPRELARHQALRFRTGALHGPEGRLALVFRLALADLRLGRPRPAVGLE